MNERKVNQLPKEELKKFKDAYVFLAFPNRYVTKDAEGNEVVETDEDFQSRKNLLDDFNVKMFAAGLSIQDLLDAETGIILPPVREKRVMKMGKK